MLGFSITDPSNSLEWMIFLAKKYSGMFLEGTWLTLYIAVAGTILGFLLGYIIGIIQDIRINEGDSILKKGIFKILKAICRIYVEVFRDTPMIVQAMVLYYGIRQANVNITPLFAGVMVTVLNTGAYMAETVRAGIGSIDMGQREGAWAMGMSPMKTMIYVVLPQAFKNVLPALGNEFIVLVKETSVAGYVALQDLTYVGNLIRSRTYEAFFPLISVAAIYLVIVLILTYFLKKLERRLRSSDH